MSSDDRKAAKPVNEGRGASLLSSSSSPPPPPPPPPLHSPSISLPSVSSTVSSKNNRKYLYPLLFVLLMLQFGLQPSINKKFIQYNLPIEKGFSKVSLGIVTELFKIIIVLVAFNKEVVRDLKRITLFNSLQYAAAPALVYTVQNFLVESARELMDSMTFNLLNQTKILSTALCMFLFFGKKQSMLQIVAIFLLMFAAVLLTAGDSNTATNNIDKESSTLGIIFIMIASMTSGLASALCHRANEVKLDLLPTDPPGTKQQRSSYTSSAEMAIFQILIPVVLEVLRVAWSLCKSGESVTVTFHFTNWSPSAFFPPIINACGGIVVGLYSLLDNGQVKKSFALIAGLLVTALADYVINNKPVTQIQIYAGCIVALSLYLHTAYPIPPPSSNASDKKKN